MRNCLAAIAAVFVAALVAMPAAAQAPPPAAVAKVGIEVAKLGLTAAAVDTAASKCTSKPCVEKSFAAFYNQARNVDGALKALWGAAGKSGPCASAAATAGAGFDALTKSYRAFEASVLKGDQVAVRAAYAQIETTTPHVTAVVSSFKTKCR